MHNQDAWIQLGNYIKKIREEKNISAYFIEQKYGYSRNAWSRIENGKLKSALKPETLQEIASYLKINYLELYLIVGYVDIDSVIDFVNKLKKY